MRRCASAPNTSPPARRLSPTPPSRRSAKNILGRRTSLPHCSEIHQLFEPASQDGALPQEPASRDGKSRVPPQEAASQDDAAWPPHSRLELARGKACLFANNLDTTTFSSDDLCALTLDIFRAAGLPDLLAQDEGRVQRLILGARARMWTQNPYHSWGHVVDMTAAAYDMARRTGAITRFSPWERFALLASALLHDLDHPGVSNIETAAKLGKKSRSAFEFNSEGLASKDGIEGRPTLEQHHLRCALSLLEEVGMLPTSGLASASPPRAMLAGMSPPECDALRRAVTANILATDLQRHACYTAQYEALGLNAPTGSNVVPKRPHTQADAGGSTPPPLSHTLSLSRCPSSEVSHQLEMELIMKSADLSNCGKAFPVAARWALRVTDEFYAEGDALVAQTPGEGDALSLLDPRLASKDGIDPGCEADSPAARAEGDESPSPPTNRAWRRSAFSRAMPRAGIPARFDRRVTTRVAVQKGFVDALASPWFDGMVRLYPEMGEFAAGVRANREVWEGVDDVELEAMRDW